jgi:hypothetical protein
MGLFNGLKRLFSGDEEGDKGIYIYVKLSRRGEVVRLRLQPGHDLNSDYESGGYTSHKSIIGPRTFERAEATFRFDGNYALIDSEITGGEVVDEAAWEASETPQA